MTLSEARAKIVAQRIEEATKLAIKVNARGYNWMPLIEFINDYDRPLDIARNLKSIYYDFVDYVVREGECGGDIVADNLYVFRRLVGALEDMQNPDEDRVMVIGVSGDGFSFDPKSQKL